jgi:hypothetical protein
VVRLPSCARHRPYHAQLPLIPVVPALLALDAPHPPPQPIFAPPPPPDHPPVTISDDPQSPPQSDDTEMGEFFFDIGDGGGFESDYYTNDSDEGPTPPEIDDTDTEEYDTAMTENFTDKGEASQHGFVEDKDYYQNHWLNEGYNSMYPANFPVPVDGSPLDSVGTLLHHMDIGM